MNKVSKIILIISVIVFGGIFLFPYSAQAGEVWFGDKNIFVDFDELPFNLSNWAPGMSDVKSITINNGEDFDINLYFKAKKPSGDEVLADVLTITINNKSNHLSDLFDGNITLTPVNSGKSQDYNIAISFDEDAGNEYQGKSINFDFIITAEQIGKGNGEIPPVVIPGGGGGGYYPTDLIIYDQIASGLETVNVMINWRTNLFSTSRVIYDTESHSTLGNPPNYGYTFSTSEDSTKVTFHTVEIEGLTPGVTYYYRCVSHTSPDETISGEYSFTTLGEIAPGEEEEEEEEEGPIIAPGEEEEEEEGPIIAPGEEEEGEEEDPIIAPGEEEGSVAPGEEEEGEEVIVAEAEEEEGIDFNKFLAAIGTFFGSANFCWLFFALILILTALFLLSLKRSEKYKTKKRWIWPLAILALVVLYCIFCCSNCWLLILIISIMILLALLLVKKKEEKNIPPEARW